jgi:hypothetical protein
VLEAIPDRIGDYRVSNDLGPVSQWQLRCEHRGLADRALFEDFASEPVCSRAARRAPHTRGARAERAPARPDRG